MSATVSEQQQPAHETASNKPPAMDEEQPRTTSRLAITPAAASVIAALSVVFFYFVMLPLWHTDLWGHLSYGRYLHQAGSLPLTEPLMTLSEGVRFVDTAWLSQLAGYFTVRAFGVIGLQVLFAVGVTFCAGLLAWRVWRRTGSGSFTLLSIAVFVWVGWQHLSIVRPQLAGLACFVALFVLMTARHFSRANWVVVPLLFALWANLHGSFLVGLALLGALCVGRGCDVLRRTDKFAAIIGDHKFRRLLLLTELAAAAVLLNPYGVELYPAVLSVSGNPNLSDIVEWEPLTLRMKMGKAAAAVSLLLVMLYRVSPRRVRVAEILILVGLGVAALWVSRMIIWWAPVAAYFAALHGHAAWKRAAKKRTASSRWFSRPSILWTGLSLIVVVLAGASKAAEPAIRGRQGDRAVSRLSQSTPIAAVAHLREYPPTGQVFNSYEWGDYLLWAGPPDVPVFVASHAHLIPREVWQAYMQVMNVSDGWSDTLDRFGANSVLIEKQRRRALAARLREDDAWQVTYEDDLAMVFRRVNPIGAP